MSDDFVSQNAQTDSFDEVMQTINRYYRKARLLTWLIPGGFLMMFCSIFLGFISANALPFAFGIGFVSIACGIVGTCLMLVKTRKYVKNNCVEPMLRGELESLTHYDGKMYGRYNKERTTLDVLDMQCIVEYLNLLSGQWWYCSISDQFSGKINGHEFSFGDVDLQKQYNKAMVSLFKGQIFVYPLKEAVSRDYRVGIDPDSAEIIVRFVNPSEKTESPSTHEKYNILNEIKNGAESESLDVLGNVVDIETFKNGIRELRDVANAPFVVYFSGHSMILIIQSDRNVLEIDAKRGGNKIQREEDDFTSKGEEKSVAAIVKNAYKLQKEMMTPGILMQYMGFGPIDSIMDNCRSDCVWIANVAYAAAKMCG